MRSCNVDLGTTQHCCRVVAKLTCSQDIQFVPHSKHCLSLQSQSVSAAVLGIVGNMHAMRG
jgi:hypothetical protein